MWLLAESVMTENQWLAFWLQHHEGFSQRQIGRALGISRQAVRDRVEGGTDRLRLAMKEAA